MYPVAGALWQFTEPLNGFIYFVASNNSGIQKLNLTAAAGSTSTAIATSIGIPDGVTLYNGNLYATRDKKVYKVLTSTGSIDTTWGTSGYVDTDKNLNLCAAATDGNLYAGTDRGGLAMINLNTATVITVDLKVNGASVSTSMFGSLTIHQNYLYSGVNQTLFRVNLSNYADYAATVHH
jgi:hypothetical protein